MEELHRSPPGCFLKDGVSSEQPAEDLHLMPESSVVYQTDPHSDLTMGEASTSMCSRSWNLIVLLSSACEQIIHSTLPTSY